MLKDCKDIISYRKEFFYNYLDGETKRQIVEHLQVCKKCLNAYKDYATSIGLDFDLLREIIRLDTTINSVADAPKEKWQTCVKLNDYSELMNVKAVKDIMLATKNNTADDKLSEGIRLFNMFLFKKICQRIDLLERCLEIPEVSK